MCNLKVYIINLVSIIVLIVYEYSLIVNILIKSFNKYNKSINFYAHLSESIIIQFIQLNKKILV